MLSGSCIIGTYIAGLGFDLSPASRVLVIFGTDSPANNRAIVERVTVRPKGASHCLVDNDDSRCAEVIGRVEWPSMQNRDFESIKELWGDRCPSGVTMVGPGQRPARNHEG